MSKIVPCLWFDGEAEEAATYYMSLFPNSKVTTMSRYSGDMMGRKAGDVMVIAFELDGRPFTALNGGPMFKFSEAISLMVNCETQAEIDHYWNGLSAGGAEGQCGWLKDRYGLSWQIVPSSLGRLMSKGTPEQNQRTTKALMGMRKLDIDALRRAGGEV
jgi:predicted 3-demethylubiquinone-9 3-methyltransferase (glyoxalase superfamily)